MLDETALPRRPVVGFSGEATVVRADHRTAATVSTAWWASHSPAPSSRGRPPWRAAVPGVDVGAPDEARAPATAS
ncbi:hypothetical protein ACI8AG_01045 [Blastococcus sp. SYSU DS0552]